MSPLDYEDEVYIRTPVLYCGNTIVVLVYNDLHCCL